MGGLDEPLEQKSRITAFVIDEAGKPSVECWEISSVTESQQVQHVDGSKATAYRLSMAKQDDLEGVDVLTWPTKSRIWPPPAPPGTYAPRERKYVP